MGYEVYRKSKKDNVEFPIDQRPLYIEFLGVSGVGKSYIYKEISNNQSNFWSIEDFKKNINNCNEQKLLDNLSFYQNLAKTQWKYIDNLDILNVEKFRIAHWNYKTLLDDALIFLYNTNSVIISDEGILHNFQHALLKISTESPNLFEDFIKKRAVVYCFSPTDIIVDQILKRKEITGRVIAHHKGKSKEELEEIVKIDLEKKEEFSEFLINSGIPLLRINTQDCLEFNSNKLNEFIFQLNSIK